MVSGVAHSYAQALADVAFEDGRPEDVAAELESFHQLMPEGSELAQALLSPAVPFASKKAVIIEIARLANFQATVTNALLTLIHNARLGRLDEVLEAYRREVDKRQGVKRVEVLSGKPLEENLRRRLEATVAELVGDKSRYDYQTDKSLIGGLKIRIGSTVFDGSVRTQLQQMQKRLSS